MNNFSEFQIKPPERNFTGDKIKIEKVLNVKIAVLDYRIGKGNFNDQRLDLQIEFKGERRVIFSGSRGLIDMIKQVPAEKLPFETTIIKDNEQFQFT